MAGAVYRRWRRHGVPRAAWLVALLFVVPLAPATVVHASEAPPRSEDRTSVALAEQRTVPVDPNRDSDHMWVWSKGGRGYLLTHGSLQTGLQKIRAVDLTTGEDLGSQDLEHPAFSRPGYFHNGMERALTVDEDGGRLFVATQHTIGNTGALNLPDTLVDQAGYVTRGQPCVRVTDLACLNGVSVLNAETLELIRHIPLQPLRVDGGAAGAELLAMEYAPPTDDQPAKVHLLVQEMATYAEHFLIDGAFARYNPRQFGPALTYVVQMDPATGRQDWVVRVDACTGNRYAQNSTDLQQTQALPYRAALFRGRAAGDRAVYVACHTRTQPLTVGVVRVPLDERGVPAGGLSVPVAPDPGGLGEGSPSPDRLSPEPPARQEAVEGPDRVFNMIADPESGRFLLQVLDGKPMAQVWWVFDTDVMQFIGTIGIGGPVHYDTTMAGLARSTGRLYVLTEPRTEVGRSFDGGLFVADVRTSPVAQALHYPEFGEVYPLTSTSYDRFPLVTQALPEGGVRVWFVESIEPFQRDVWRALEDHRPPLVPPQPLDYEGRTLDIPEDEGVTTAALDGAARGYGVRMLLLGGAEAATRMGPIDPAGNVRQCNDPDWGRELNLVSHFPGLLVTGRTTGGPCYYLGVPFQSPCTDGNREIVFASVGPDGPAVVDGQGARGAAEPLSFDPLTQGDLERPGTRCTAQDWEVLWSTALFGRPPAPEPALPSETSGLMVECVSTSPDSSDQVAHPLGGYSAGVDCAKNEAAGYAYTRGGSIEGVSVAEALSSFRIYRDPGRGIVSRVESIARGVSIDGLVRIDTVRGVAESWANGHAQPVPREAREAGYDANCDMERSAGTCFQRHLFGLSTPVYSCGPCGDERAFVEALNAVFNPNVTVRLREPDASLRVGANNGFTAAIQKPEHERFGDLVLNNDLLQTVLPTLEVIRYAPPNRPISREGTRGRQVYQFAGVEVSSSYGIQCLLVYDEAAGTCAPPVEETGSLTMALTDVDGAPLAGGVFEVRRDVDADGALGLVDELVGDSGCVTGQDGTGTCVFDGLAPGGYLVSQTAAPDGYALVAEPWLSQVAPGEARTVTFTNASSVSTIEVSATDEAGAPLEGAVFAVLADPDADGKVAADAVPVASCTTGADGTCSMRVPAGSYVLVQTAAPGGLAPIEPIAFALASGGQTAAVGVVNAAPAADGVPEAPGPAAPVYSDGPAVSPPVEAVAPAPTGAAPRVTGPGVAEQVGGTVTRVIRAPADALRLLARSPMQAVAWTATLALLALAAMAITRRRQALRLLAAHGVARPGPAQTRWTR